jgi:hypothetical protein
MFLVHPFILGKECRRLYKSYIGFHIKSIHTTQNNFNWINHKIKESCLQILISNHLIDTSSEQRTFVCMKIQKKWANKQSIVLPHIMFWEFSLVPVRSQKWHSNSYAANVNKRRKELANLFLLKFIFVKTILLTYNTIKMAFSFVHFK